MSKVIGYIRYHFWVTDTGSKVLNAWSDVTSEVIAGVDVDVDVWLGNRVDTAYIYRIKIKNKLNHTN